MKHPQLSLCSPLGSKKKNRAATDDHIPPVNRLLPSSSCDYCRSTSALHPRRVTPSADRAFSDSVLSSSSPVNGRKERDK
ncbi:unnamed protein product [Linum trigynum]|uniref:Uncharacterized protein n=1 Tax=Linum trigynum TaxID=586398 RepID=A0AAV2E9V7_9ROSI